MTAGLGQVYVPLRTARPRFVTVRGIRYHLREWGTAGAPMLVLVHGARDSSASFQFLVDALEHDWHVLAPDWRGNGLSGWTPGSYWISDFLCDLDALLGGLAPDRPVVLVGHSMGGNVAGAYSGLRPRRIARLVMLDALGNPLDRSPVRMAETLTQFLDAEATRARLHIYEDTAQMADRLRRANRRLDAARATYLAGVNSRPMAGGGHAWAWDPSFRKSWPTLHSTEEWAECWRGIEAPVLCLLSSDPRHNAATSDAAAIQERSQFFRDIRTRVVPETGHNLHIDAPQFVAREIESFAR